MILILLKKFSLDFALVNKMIFDTHIHLNDEKLYENLDIYIEEARNCGVSTFMCIGYDLESSIKACEIASKYDFIYASIGFIPTEHLKYSENSIKDLEELYKKYSLKIKCIGEIGLDYYWENNEEIKKKQKQMFKEQIELANRLNLPISIHARNSIQDTFDILKENKVINTGIMHCYNGSKEMAKEFIKLGYKIAFGGVLTFKNSKETKEVISSISLKDIVFETDAPYLAPTPYRGKINEPRYIVETIKYASDLLNVNYEELCKITYNNSKEAFKI